MMIQVLTLLKQTIHTCCDIRFTRWPTDALYTVASSSQLTLWAWTTEPSQALNELHDACTLRFTRWPTDALYTVASTFLANLVGVEEATIQVLPELCVAFHQGLHALTGRYAVYAGTLYTMGPSNDGLHGNLAKQRQ